MSECPGLERGTLIDNSGSAGGVPPKNPRVERQAMVLAFMVRIARGSHHHARCGSASSTPIARGIGSSSTSDSPALDRSAMGAADRGAYRRLPMR
jgi:hypothetical protein